jgi:hypothetical protein
MTRKTQIKAGGQFPVVGPFESSPHAPREEIFTRSVKTTMKVTHYPIPRRVSPFVFSSMLFSVPQCLCGSFFLALLSILTYPALILKVSSKIFWRSAAKSAPLVAMSFSAAKLTQSAATPRSA